MMLNRAKAWLRSVVLRRRLEREMREEMAQHLWRSQARLEARGLTTAEARRQALREFGNVACLQEEARDTRGAVWLDALLADCRFALRHFARKPLTALTMLLVLAVGMSITTLLFSYVHSYATRPPQGMERAEDLVRIRGSRTAGADGRTVRTFSEDEFREYQRLAQPFRAVTGWADATVAVEVAGDAERQGLDARAIFTTSDYFQVMGVQPVLGRSLPGEGSEGVVAVISYVAWDQLFGHRPDALGSELIVNGVRITVIGVAPPRFRGPSMFGPHQLWLPLSAREQLLPQPPSEFRVAARLRPGVSLEAASSAVATVAAALASNDEQLRALEPSSDVVPLLSANGDPMFDRDVRLMTSWVGLLALLVLLVTCTNVSALLTGLATARRHEIAVRLSLGAQRTRLIRQLLTESALLSVVAAGGAVGIVWAALRLTETLVAGMPFDMTITWPATLFTFGVALTVGVLFGLSPALHATRLALASALHDSVARIAAARGRLQRALVIAQIAFTQPLVVLLAAVLVVVIFQLSPMSSSDSADRVAMVWLRPAASLGDTEAAAAEAERQVHTAVQNVAARLRQVPGIDLTALEWSSEYRLGTFLVADQAGATPRAVQLSAQPVGEDYFDALGVSLLRGREFARTDAAAAPYRGRDVPAIIGSGLARELWHGADPIGRRLNATSDTTGGPRSMVIVGVIDDPRDDTRRAHAGYRVYLPADTSGTAHSVLVRTAGRADALLPTLRRVVQVETRGMAPTIRTLEQIENGRRHYFRLVSSGLSVAGLMALLLSALGLYAVIAFAVGERTSEIAVRMAVGARSRQIVQEFLGAGLLLSGIGLAIGLPISLFALHVLMNSVADLPKVSLTHVTAVVASGVLLITLIAVWLPARRAASIDPAVTLRRE